MAVEGGVPPASPAAQSGKPRPDDERDRQDVAPVGAIGEPGNRNAARDIKQRQRPAREHRHAGVIEMQIEADRFEHRGYDVAVGNVDGVNQAHQDEHIPALDR
jgi:hypothetical protein